MENVFLKQLADKNLKGSVASDVNSPLSFLEWKQRSPQVPDRDIYFHYQRYVLDWFSTNKNKTVSQKFVLRQKYLFLLEQLQMFFTEDEKNIWYNRVNLADEKELLSAIPYFAKKLRDIAVYYLNLRKRLKSAKFKYNTVGTTKAVENEIYSYLLNVLTPDNPEFSPEFLTLSPMFSALQQSLVVQVDELYDDNQYFDRSPTAPLSSYVNVLDAATASFFQTKGITLSSDSWLLNTFSLPVTGDLNTLVDRLTGTVFETTDVNLYGNFIQNYLAENKYTLTYTIAPSAYSVSDIPLSAGNNRFFYPYGLVDTTLTIDGQTVPIALSSIQTTGAGTGTTLEQSDSIFVKYGNTIKGAWYRFVEYDNIDGEMDAFIENNKTTTFVYPFPGYGLSSEETPWTGASLTSNQEYPFLSKNIKAAIQQQYWSSPLSSNACFDIFLNNTTAVSSQANADEDFKKADKIYLRDRNMVYDTSLPVRELSGAWLYKFTKTALPVSPYQPNVILWPYDIIDTTLSDLPEHLQNQNFQDVCSPIPIQEFDRSYFIAASSIDLADKIYKLRYFNDNEQTMALECAWLSAATDTVGLHSFVKQDGLSLSLSAGEITRFVWTGADNTPLSSVFTSVSHQADCPFVTNVPTVSSYEWQKCTCKQPYYSPLGHSGYRFTENNSLADFIVEDTASDFSNFDIGSWTDLSGNDVLNSNSFAWYNTFDKNSWGNGVWTSQTLVSATSASRGIPDTNTLSLKYGHSYFYGRANSNLTRTPFPHYNVLNSFNTNNTVWMQAKPNENKNSWVATNLPSKIVARAGDFFKIVRQQQTTSYYLSSVVVENFSSNQGSAWATYDSIAINPNPLLNATVISWPENTKVVYGDQYPSLSLTKLLTPNPPQYFTYAQLTALFFSSTPTVTAEIPPPVGRFVEAHSKSTYREYGGSGSITITNLITAVSLVGVAGGGGGGSAQEVDSGGGGGGGGSGGMFARNNFTVREGDVISYSVGGGGSGSRIGGRGQIGSGYSGGGTSITITRPGVGVIYSGSASGGGGGGGGRNGAGGGGGGGGFPGGGSGSSGSGGTGDRASASGGRGAGARYGGYGAGGNGASSFDRTSPLYWNGNSGSGGVAAITFYQYVPRVLEPPAPVILLNGSSTIQVLSGTTYTELSAKVYDGKDSPNGKLIIPTSGSVNTMTPGTYTLTYSYTNTLGIPALPVTRTVNVYNAPRVPTSSTPQILQWNVVNVQTSASQSFYNTPVFTFVPSTTGTFYIEVTGRNVDGNYLFLYGASSPKLLNSTEPTIIPDLTAIPGQSHQIANTPIYAPTGGFLIEQPLRGWSYRYNGIQLNQLDNNVGAKPYWAAIYKDKEPSTRSKGIYTWGYPYEYIDDYLPHHIPRLSPLKLQYGTILEYERNGTSFWWSQPLVFQSAVGTSRWSTLNFGTNISNLSSVFETENVRSLTAFATTEPSDIILTNNVDGTPVTVLYYALSSFVWSVSTVSVQDVVAPPTQLYYQSQEPFGNLSNRFFPTIATVPTLESLYSKDDVGGYFVPQNLGASQFINKDFTAIAPVSTSLLSAEYIVEDSSVHIGGRGLSKQKQNSIYDWSENNLWVKESSTTGKLAGFVRKNLTKQLQTFIPYQSNNADNSIGLVTPQSRVTPWGGEYHDEWVDLAREPKSFTGVRNVSAWSEMQVLKQNGKVADNWVTDVYGNQYGVFKQLSGVSIADRATTPGELWVRTNNQVVRPGYVALSSIFGFADNSFYSELTGSVLNVDCFFDVLMIHTPSTVLFSRISYDYETDEITSAFDNTRGYFGFPLYVLTYKSNILTYLDQNLTYDALYF